MREKSIELGRKLRIAVGQGHLLRFLLVGGASFAIDLGLLVILHEVFGVDLWIATPIAFLVSLGFNFFVQRSFTFQSSARAHVSFLKYGALVVFNLVATDLIVNVFDYWGLAYTFGKVFATVATTLWNFLLYKYWIFPSEAGPTPEDTVLAATGLLPTDSARD
jgi:putative flippase GtrA